MLDSKTISRLIVILDNKSICIRNEEFEKIEPLRDQEKIIVRSYYGNMSGNITDQSIQLICEYFKIPFNTMVEIQKLHVDNNMLMSSILVDYKIKEIFK